MKPIEEFTNRIINGDSLQVLREMPDESVDLIITSPPYFGCRVYGNETLGREKDPREYIAHVFEFTKEIKRVLSKQGSFYLNIGDVYFGTKGFGRVINGKHLRKTHKHYEQHDIVAEDGKYLQHKQLLLIPPRIAIEMQNDGWILRNSIAWEKGNACPNFAKDRRLPVYEYIFHFVKGRDYYFDFETAKKLDHHRDVIRCNIEAFGKHQATFPEKLIYPFIMTTSKENDIVLDPFGGCATVGLVCQKNNRRYILIELNEKYCEDASNRLKNAKGLWGEE